jgi:hypothetical protein
MKARSWVFRYVPGSLSECPNGRNLEAQLPQPEPDLEELSDAADTLNQIEPWTSNSKRSKPSTPG